MAQLSSHPSILTVYQASVAADGRPYLVMEYCSSTLGQRYRAVQLPLAEVLSIGVRIASAVETAHRQGVLHRDIKPSNILTTAYGHPVLSDFGIAATLGEAETTEAVGLSIPWSAPEVLHDDVSGTVASEVWSLGATVYSLLAGRSPFEVPGRRQRVGRADGAHREGEARRRPGGSTCRAASSACSRRAMSRRPDDRQASALEFIRDLQSVEEELGLPQTPIEVAMDDWALATAVDLDERTRISGQHAVGERPGRTPPHAPLGDSRASGTVLGVDSGRRGEHGPRRAPPRRRRGASCGASRSRPCSSSRSSARASSPCVQGTRGIPVVTDVQVSVDGTAVTFTWDDPGHRERRRLHRDRRRRALAAATRCRASTSAPRTATGSARPSRSRATASPARRAPRAASTSRPGSADAPARARRSPVGARDGGCGHGRRRGRRRRRRGIRRLRGAARRPRRRRRLGRSTTGSQAVGRANTAVLELNSVVETGGVAAEIVQQGSTVLVLDRDRASVGIVDRDHVDGHEDGRGAAGGPPIALAGDRVVVAADGDVWTTPADDFADFDGDVGPRAHLRCRCRHLASTRPASSSRTRRRPARSRGSTPPTRRPSPRRWQLPTAR